MRIQPNNIKWNINNTLKDNNKQIVSSIIKQNNNLYIKPNPSQIIFQNNYQSLSRSANLSFKLGSIFIQTNDDGLILSDYANNSKRYIEWNTISLILPRLQLKFIFKNLNSLHNLYSHYDFLRILKLYLQRNQLASNVSAVCLNQYPNSLFQLNQFIHFYPQQESTNYTLLALFNTYDNKKVQGYIDCYFQEYGYFFKKIGEDQYLKNINQRIYSNKPNNQSTISNNLHYNIINNSINNPFILPLYRKHPQISKCQLQKQINVSMLQQLINQKILRHSNNFNKICYKSLFILKNNIKVYIKILLDQGKQKEIEENHLIKNQNYNRKHLQKQETNNNYVQNSKKFNNNTSLVNIRCSELESTKNTNSSNINTECNIIKPDSYVIQNQNDQKSNIANPTSFTIIITKLQLLSQSLTQNYSCKQIIKQSPLQHSNSFSQQSERCLSIPFFKLFNYIPLYSLTHQQYLQKYGRIITQFFGNFQSLSKNDPNMLSINFQIIVHCYITQMIQIGKYWTVISVQVIGTKKEVIAMVIRYNYLPENKQIITVLLNPYSSNTHNINTQNNGNPHEITNKKPTNCGTSGFLWFLTELKLQHKNSIIRNKLLIKGNLKQTYLYLQKYKKINQISSLIEYLSQGVGII